MARSMLDVWSRWMWCIGSIVGLALLLNEGQERIGFALFGASILVLMFDIVVLKEEESHD